MNHENTDSKVIYFCAGIGLGVAAGVLFAPDSGTKLRGLLRQRTVDGADYVTKKAGAVTGKATETVEQAMKTVRHQKENLVAALDAGKQAYQEAVKTTPGVISTNV